MSQCLIDALTLQNVLDYIETRKEIRLNIHCDDNYWICTLHENNTNVSVCHTCDTFSEALIKGVIELNTMSIAKKMEEAEKGTAID